MRVWVPLTLADLAAHHAAGEVPRGQERLVADEDEESEYAALVEAAALSAALLLEQGDPGGRRVVAVAELGPGADPDGPIALRHVVAVHADTRAGAGHDEDLGWFAPQEVPALLTGDL